MRPWEMWRCMLIGYFRGSTSKWFGNNISSADQGADWAPPVTVQAPPPSTSAAPRQLLQEQGAPTLASEPALVSSPPCWLRRPRRVPGSRGSAAPISTAVRLHCRAPCPSTAVTPVQIWYSSRCKRIRIMGGQQARTGVLAWSSCILSSGSRDKKTYCSMTSLFPVTMSACSVVIDQS
ncbi:hypothetical protein PVAP13_2NG265815 [Panicum virgatum]|uniref:Uncharacterized protein n=1 Tax=Panicum virgatum TaxID=38727 RepID=A0A8T0V9B4_PANVG|nr:hypothetical protein PVAP13_2NG265815 [Panicum virgatum]KAG2633003.1 hypothetical protein PVAP13_2NG265815 [Panicum virgatum]